jgi:hypothetical protein
MLGSLFNIKDAFCVMLILKVLKRKETMAEIIDGRVDDEIIKATKSEEATEKMSPLFF